MFAKYMNSLLGLALVACMISFAPTPSFAACQASGDGAFSAGFEVSGNVATLCATAIEVQPARTAIVVKIVVKPVVSAPIKPTPIKPVPVKPAPKPTQTVAPQPVTRVVVAKPPVVLKIIMVDRYVPPVKVTPVPVKVAPKPTPTPTLIKRPTPTPTPPAKPIVINTVTVITSPSTTTVDSGSASFSPAVMSAAVADPSLKVGQSAVFSADPFTHFRSATILGRAAEVSFTPSQVTWQFEGGGGDSGSTVSHSFSSVGTFTATARVVYAVAYRFVASGGWVSQGFMGMQAQVDVLVSASGTNVPIASPPPAATKPLVFLVARNCIGNAGSIGCLSG